MKIVRGYVEILDDALYWHSTLRINALVGQVPDITSILFGVDDHRVRKPVKPIASNRGFPEDASDETKAAYQADNETTHFATYIKLSEIAKVFEIKKLKKGWPVVFAFMGVLADLYGDNSVRLVCWFI